MTHSTKDSSAITSSTITNSTTKIAPIIFLPHGAGPLPLLGNKDYGNEHLVPFLKSISQLTAEPSAILIISAHWEAQQASLTSGKQPHIMFDYGGFPDEAYHLQYPVSGQPALAQEIYQLIKKSGMEVKLEPKRGFDHGVYVPLKLIYPEAHIPCIQLSLIKGLKPDEHIALGKILAGLRQKNVLIIGSGMSFHNLRLFFRPEQESYQKSKAFDLWLIDTCTNASLSIEEKEHRLIAWKKAPYAEYCHPREEHLLPLHVCFGAASKDTPTASVIFNEVFMGVVISGFIWNT